MTGTDELHSPNADAKLAVLIERSESTERSINSIQHLVESLSNNVVQLVSALHKMETDRITDREQLNQRSEANRAAISTLQLAHAEEIRQRIAVDAQQVQSLQAEKTDREAAASERRRAHDEDISEIKASIDGLTVEMTKVKDKLGDAVALNRIIIFIGGAFTVAFVGAFVTGHISFLVHP